MTKKATAVLKIIERQVRALDIPWVSSTNIKKNPFKVLVSCILSLRTKDTVTAESSRRLFKVAKNPWQIQEVGSLKIKELIYPVGFYRNKAKTLVEISETLISKYNGRLPPCRDKLLALKGVGRKTANLVLGLGFGIPSICVDTHVHRISNRLGWIRTDNPYDTETRLQDIIPKQKWISLNTILVAFGQNICLPVSPLCSRCSVSRWCKKRGVKHSR